MLKEISLWKIFRVERPDPMIVVPPGSPDIDAWTLIHGEKGYAWICGSRKIYSFINTSKSPRYIDCREPDPVARHRQCLHSEWSVLPLRPADPHLQAFAHHVVPN